MKPSKIATYSFDCVNESQTSTANHRWGRRCIQSRYIFETPVAVTPQQAISKTLNSSKKPEKYLTFTVGEITFTFAEITFTFGEMTFTFGEITFTFGEITFILGFLKFIFCCWEGGVGGGGGAVGVFENI